MIYIKLEGHDFRYETEDVIKLFYKDEAVLFLENQPPEDYRGIFLLCRAEDNEGLVLYTALESDGGLCYEHTKPMPLLAGLAEVNERERLRRLKKEIKVQLYLALSMYTGIKMPWGVLTGVRPAKIAREMLEGGASKEAVLAGLDECYMVSRKKSELIYDIAVVEKSILDRASPEMVSLYIGIPFCTTRCLYCSFTSNPVNKYKGMVGKYLEALKGEITGTNDIIEKAGLKLQSIYIGGGTPTSIDAPSLRDLLQYVEHSFDLSHLEEYTLEAGRPDSIDKEKLEIIKGSRVDRISINPQTMNEETLKLIGRSHTPGDIKQAFELAREIGFDNINMDIIVGLPGENAAMFENTLNEIRVLSPESLTVHTMAIKRASRLNEKKDSYSSLIVESGAAQMVELAGEYAGTMGMHPYYLYRQKNMLGNLENVGYCKPGFDSIYNIQIMEEKQTIIALGAGAVTKVVYPCENRLERAFNVKSVEEYIARMDEMVERKRALMR